MKPFPALALLVLGTSALAQNSMAQNSLVGKWNVENKTKRAGESVTVTFGNGGKMTSRVASRQGGRTSVVNLSGTYALKGDRFSLKLTGAKLDPATVAAMPAAQRKSYEASMKKGMAAAPAYTGTLRFVNRDKFTIKDKKETTTYTRVR